MLQGTIKMSVRLEDYYLGGQKIFVVTAVVDGKERLIIQTSAADLAQKITAAGYTNGEQIPKNLMEKIGQNNSGL